MVTNNTLHEYKTLQEGNSLQFPTAPFRPKTTRPPLSMYNISPRRSLMLAVLAYAAVATSFAHALPPQGAELESRSLADGPAVMPVGGDAVERKSLDREPPLPRPPTSLLRDMAWRNAPRYNITELGERECHERAERLNSEREDYEESCAPSYSCDYDRLRYPNWMVFVNCSQQYCDTARYPVHTVCLAYEDWIVALRYFEADADRSEDNTESGTTESDGSEGQRDGGGEGKRKESTESRGEWRLWRTPVPSQCLCVQ